MFYEDDEVITNLSKVQMIEKQPNGELKVIMTGARWDFEQQMGINLYWFTKSEAPGFLKKYREYMKEK